MRRYAVFLSVPILCAVVGLPAAANAQAPAAGAADDAATEAMRERFEKGQDYYEQRKYEAAASEFRAAYEIKPAASLLYNEAVCYEKLRDFNKAANLFRRYLSDSPNARDRKAVETRIAALEQEAKARKDPREKRTGPTIESLGSAEVRGVFLIESKPAGATIYLDDKNQPPLGTTPWNGTIDGEHTVIVVAKGFKDEKKAVRGKPNSVNTLYIALSQEHYLGWLEVRANVAAADVYIDGKEAGAAGKTPFMGNITPGKHTIIVTKEGFTEEVKEMEIAAGEPHKIEAMLEKAPIGFIQVGGSTVEGARVLVDGKVVCEAAPCRFQSPSGERNIVVEKKGLKPYKRKLNVPKASETALSVKLAPQQPRTDLIWKFGFAAAFIGGGIFLGLQANSIQSEIEDEIAAGNPPLGPDDDRFTKGKIYAIAADGLFVVGTVTAAFAVISMFSEKGAPSTGFVSDTRDLAQSPLIDRRPKAIIAPAIGPNYAGVAAEVRW
jgi:tetratricopeptide (TPR) repeat protein